MTFAKVFRGYSPAQVEQYIASQKKKCDNLLLQQRQRIEELADENHNLTQQLAQHTANSQSIADALIDARQCAQKLRTDAENYSKAVVARANVFLQAWQSVAQTLVCTLSREELKQLNALCQRICSQQSAYCGQAYSPKLQNPIEKITRAHQQVAAVQAAQTEGGTMHEGAQQMQCQQHNAQAIDAPQANTATQQAGAHVIDLDELAMPTQSLEELCKSLGLK